MLHRSARLAAIFFTATCPVAVLGQQGQPPQFFVVCGSQPALPTVYFSGVLQGPASAFTGFRAGFTTFLAQHYSYSGAVSCAPTNNALNAQNFIISRATAFRKAKKSVVETGWTESAVAAAAPVAPSIAPSNAQSKMSRGSAAPAAAAAAVTGRGHSAPSGASTAGGSDAPVGDGSASAGDPLTSVLGSIFGAGAGAGGASSGGSSGGSSGADCGGTSAGVKAGAAKTGAKGDATGAGGGGCAGPLDEVSKVLASAFAGKAAGGAAAEDTAPKGAQPVAAAAGLGSAQAQNTKLVVYGCGRQDKRVACVTELTNQNQKDTLVQAADVWKDAFIVDDRGDRHQRSGGFFLNVDGEQRQQLDISYGKSAQFILMFDQVPPKVQKVSLRSSSASLNVEDIGLLAPNAAAQGQ